MKLPPNPDGTPLHPVDTRNEFTIRETTVTPWQFVLIAGCGLYLLATGRTGWWLPLGATAVFLIVALVMQESSYILLEADGFTASWLGIKSHYRWSDVESFETRRSLVGKKIICRLAPHAKQLRNHGTLYRWTWGDDPVLFPSSWGIGTFDVGEPEGVGSARELSEMLDAWRKAALGIHADDGDPYFGRMTEDDRQRVVEMAKVHGLDLCDELEKAGSGDAVALGRFLALSSNFTRLDSVARAYGNLVYSSFQHFFAARGEKFFAAVLESQSPPVQQRIRDFIWSKTCTFPSRLDARTLRQRFENHLVRWVSKGHRAEIEAETRRMYPLIFRPTYEFARDDQLFD